MRSRISKATTRVSFFHCVASPFHSFVTTTRVAKPWVMHVKFWTAIVNSIAISVRDVHRMWRHMLKTIAASGAGAVVG